VNAQAGPPTRRLSGEHDITALAGAHGPRPGPTFRVMHFHVDVMHIYILYLLLMCCQLSTVTGTQAADRTTGPGPVRAGESRVTVRAWARTRHHPSPTTGHGLRPGRRRVQGSIEAGAQSSHGVGLREVLCSQATESEEGGPRHGASVAPLRLAAGTAPSLHFGPPPRRRILRA
jgi:hypothetical protein